MTSAISGKLVRGKRVYNAAQVRHILMSELSDGDDGQDDVEVSDDDGEVDVLESHSEASSDSECVDSAEVEVDKGPTYRSKNNQETWHENPQRNTEGRRAAKKTSCTSLQDRREREREVYLPYHS